MNYDLLIDLHKGNPRQGPGGEEQTKQALMLSGLQDVPNVLQIADIGCGTGASTLTLAKNLNANITAVDLFPDFLEVLQFEAQQQGIADKVNTRVCSMSDLPFAENSLDAIWSEGAIYNMVFAKGVEYFKRFLKPGGILAVSEITWLANDRPAEVQNYWTSEYPEIATDSEKIHILEEQGFMMKGYFPLPESCWIENYYTPLENSFDTFLTKHNSDDAKTIIKTEQTEIAFYKDHHAYYSYGFYIAQNTENLT